MKPDQPAESPPARSGPIPGPKRAIVYLAWGDKYVAEAIASAESVLFMGIPVILITDRASAETIPHEHPFHEMKIVDFTSRSLVTKAYLFDYLPEAFESFLFLDTDTRVLKDISLGFEKSERHGLALAPAPHYGLDQFFGFGRIMKGEGFPTRGQLQFNTGVIFFTREPAVQRVFETWKAFATSLPGKYRHKETDQPFFTLALEQCETIPYCLAPTYNYRALAGEHLVGDVYIWHSRQPVPRKVNDYQQAWPPRSYVGWMRLNMAPIQRFSRLVDRLLRRA